MKSIFKNICYSLVVSLTFGLTACDSYLEEDNLSNVTDGTYFNENNADELVVSAYKQLREVYRTYDGMFYGTDLYTQMGEVFSINGENEYVNINSAWGGNLWAYNYGIISRANVAINRFENQISWSEANLDSRDNGIAQAKVLRALAYYNLVLQYGGVPLILNEVEEIRFDYTRASEQEVFALIIAEIEESMPKLEASPEVGRISVRAAQHLLADVYLTRGYKSYAGTNDFTTAASLAESAIGSYDIRSQSFAQLFEYGNQVNDEVLLSVQYGTGINLDDRNNNKHSICKNSVNDYIGIARANPYATSSTSFMPTQYFYGLFADNDSREAVTFHRALIANEAATYTSANGTHNVVPGDTVVYYPKHALEATELAEKMNRYYVYQPDQYYYGVPTEIPGVIYQYSNNNNRTNFPIFKKFDDVNFDESEGGYRDTYVFRIAETHLIAAEAYLNAGQESQALTHINRVRERATGNANYYTSLTIDNILDERAVELAGEENRWVTLKRTGKLEAGLLHNPHHVDHGKFNANIHYLRPLPERDLTLSNGALVQNEGY